MMKIAAITALIGSASAFAPASVSKVRRLIVFLLLLTFFVHKCALTDEREEEFRG